MDKDKIWENLFGFKNSSKSSEQKRRDIAEYVGGRIKELFEKINVMEARIKRLEQSNEKILKELDRITSRRNKMN